MTTTTICTAAPDGYDNRKWDVKAVDEEKNSITVCRCTARTAIRASRGTATL